MSDPSIPEELFYTTEHEWIQKLAETKIRVGITDFAQEQLGDIVYVQIPEVGTQITLGDSFAEVESTKSVSDIYAPSSGKICSINALLESNPETINSDPYGEGWLVDIELTAEELEDALHEAISPEEYQAVITGG